MTEEHIKENIILYMKNYKGNKVVPINKRLVALRAFFNFLDKHKLIPKNTMENIKLLKDRKAVIEKLQETLSVPIQDRLKEYLKKYIAIHDYVESGALFVLE
ncbi:hypothetical protein NST63_20250 [Heyndrickxia sp. FSL W8-0496]|uniref:hypothetical protein n=1 Tax=Heyndrickxia TaxID=2837504 RepID=UPI0030F4CCDB